MRSKALLGLSLAIGALAISGLSFGHTGGKKDVVCPIDTQKFTIRVTSSYTSFGSFYDFQKYGAIGDLYESYVNSCPKCHYSGYQSDFDTTFTETDKQEILKILEPFKNAEMTDVTESEIAVEIHRYFKRDNDDLANLYLVASYFIRNDSTQMEKRKELQQLCATYLEKAIVAEEYEKKSTYATINYLIGELYRRIGDFDKAIRFYDLALNDKKKHDWVEDMVQEQKKLAEAKNEDNSI